VGFIYEIRIHGRGGQGVKTTARVLGRAAFLSGFQTQDFAVYGAERRGAPVASFCRFDKEKILTRGYIFEPDAVIVLDPSLNPKIVAKGLKSEGVLLVNSPRPLEKFPKAGFVDATGTALRLWGKPVPNIAILGAFLKETKLFPFKNLKKAIKIELTEDGHPEAVLGNIKACEALWEE